MRAPDPEQAATATQAVPEAAPPADRAFTLAVTAGPDKGKRFAIDGTTESPILVGQSEACHLRLADREVSRRHAAIAYVGPSLRITDLGSTNGTRVDRVRVVEAFLTGGEIVRVGATSLRVEEGPVVAQSADVESAAFGRLVGSSRAMRRLYPVLDRLAASLVPVILEGETGTGKEVLAEALHEQGPRAKGPFVIFDCTAVPPNLVESDLFGHERGAFTGAVATRRGVFEQAEGGTLLIDEIGDLEPSLQPKLLRAIERSEIRRVGGDTTVRVDVRILAATRRDLDREVEQGRFRDDLFHRLAVARVELPPLRHREGDVAALARHFWEKLGGAPEALPADLLRKWQAARWPGNVRELRNAVARYMALGDLRAEPARKDDADVSQGGANLVDELVTSGLPFPLARNRMLEAFTARYVAHLLAKHGGNVAEAAEASGIGRRYFLKLRGRRT